MKNPGIFKDAVLENVYLKNLKNVKTTIYAISLSKNTFVPCHNFSGRKKKLLQLYNSHFEEY